MNQPTFSLAYTSVREQMIPGIVDLWRKTSSGKHEIEVVISVDSNQTACIEAAKRVQNAKVVIQDESPFNCVRGWNLAAANTTGKVIIAVADDFKPCQDWDEKLFTLKTGWVDEDWVAHTEDGYVHNICVLSILTRKRYDRFGYLFYPQYESMFCLHPDTPVYMGDYSFMPIGSILPGDTVVGVEKRFGGRGALKQKREHLIRSKVTAVHKRVAPVFKVSLQSGKTLICTKDHLWAYYADNKLTNYGTVKKGRKLVKVVEVPNNPPEGTDWERGWLAGNWINPVKRVTSRTDKRMLSARFGTPDAVAEITPIGESEVVCLTTETGNFIAGGYLSHNCDTEFTDVAYQEGRVLNAKHILMEHMHPDCNKRPRDNFDVAHSSRDRWQTGEMLFNYRKHRGFPLDDGPKAVLFSATENTAKQNSDPYANYAAYLQVTRDDLCLNEVCRRLFDEGIKNFFFCIPDEYWSGKPTPQSDIQQVLDAAQKLRDLGADARTKVFNVADYRFSGDSRIAVETRLRNDSLAWVRQNGFNKICVVDSDELWQKGTLEMIHELVDSSDPLAISLPMIPVLGFPGYPVNGATDRVIAYVGQSCVFRDCRAPIGAVYYENRTTVYHFTSTRKTMEETIEKHRQSGHFDDPEYDFEGWLKNILPNVKPGLKGAHMFRKYQIWPEVRAWSIDDLKHIPSSIYPYLAIPQDLLSKLS